MKFLKKFSRKIKSVIRSPILASVAGGLAIVFPVVGVPALAAIATANAALKTADQSAKKMNDLKKMLERTKVAAKHGDPGAVRALAAFRVVAKARRGDPASVSAVRRIVRASSIGATIASRYRTQNNGRLRRVA